MIDLHRRIALRARQRRQQRQGGWLPVALVLFSLMALMCLGGMILLLSANQVLGATLSGEPGPAVLVMGVDRRSGEQGATRSDSMIVAARHPETGQVGLLSIPRDLWVTIPGVGEQRINTALYFGHKPDDPSAGPQLAVRTVTGLGTVGGARIPVDRYLVLDFETFARLVDALGGIEVDVPQAITDSQYPTPDYGVTTIHFEPGPQVLDGERALVYVRTRHADDDFGRAERQQQVVRAIAARLMNPAIWPRLPQLYAIIQGGVQTDLAASDWLELLQIAQALANGEARAATLESPFTTPWTTPAGAWVLLPNWVAIDALVQELFGVQ